MLHSLKAIVLRSTKYNDTSLVIKAYTNLFGLRTYMVRGVRSRKGGGFSAAMFQPMSLLEMQVYERANKNIQHLKEVKAAYHYTTIPFRIEKSSLLVFLNELLNKAIQEESANEPLFDFLYDSMCHLDREEASLALFHIRFMLRLSRYLGFYPDNNYHVDTRPYFDMLEGVFVGALPLKKHSIEPPLSAYFASLIAEEEGVQMAKIHRQALLQKCIDFYNCQLPQFGDMKSLEILQTVMES